MQTLLSYLSLCRFPVCNLNECVWHRYFISFWQSIRQKMIIDPFFDWVFWQQPLHDRIQLQVFGFCFKRKSKGDVFVKTGSQEKYLIRSANCSDVFAVFKFDLMHIFKPESVWFGRILLTWEANLVHKYLVGGGRQQKLVHVIKLAPGN